MSFSWPAREFLAQLPTPFYQLKRFEVDDVSRIWVKRDDLSGFLLSGNKVRKLEFVLAQAKKLGISRIITCGGVQSNHCRATAFACAQLGLSSHLVLRQVKPSRRGGSNFLLDRIAGAEISIHDIGEYGKSLNDLLDKWRNYYEAKGERVLIVPTGASDGYGIWGYANAAKELADDFAREGISPKTVVCATGSGGTQAGLALGFALLGLDIEVVGYAVCDSAAYFDVKVESDIREWQSLNPYITLSKKPKFRTIDAYVGGGYAVPCKKSMALAVEVARKEGFLLDPVYTAKAFYGLAKDISKGHIGGSDIVFVHTGGGFGVFPFAEEFEQLT